MENNLITSTIMIDIPEYAEKYISSKVVTFYTINVYDNYSRKKWTLSKRYSDFETLYKNLQKLIPSVPPIPGKSLFKVASVDALNQRKSKLEKFLCECVNRKDIMATNYIKEFLELDRHSPNLTYNSPEKTHEFTQLPLGIRDFYYYYEENLMFAVCSDMNIASRVDSYITNVNLPWEKKTNGHVTVGAVFVFKLNLNANNIEQQFERKWAKSYREQTGVVNFNIENNILMVGLDNGIFYLYKTGIESKYRDFQEIIESKPHTARIMGIDIDPKKNLVYTCSSDKKFIMTQLSEQQSSSTEIGTGAAGFTNLVFDKENERIFLTNEIGQLFIYLTSDQIPTLVKIVQTHTKNSIRGIDVNPKKYYLFTATIKGDISVFDLGFSGKEKFIEEISFFGADVQLRIIRYNEENSELYTGDQKGKITVFSLKTGKSIFAWKGHDEAITQMFYDGARRVLITASKDKKIILWKLPEKWVNEDIEKFEKDEIKNLNDTMSMLKFQKALEKKGDESDSDDDSLDGWDIRP